MITAIEAYRYRCFSTLAVEFGDYNVLAGPNGSGKTLLLDIPTLLGDLIAQPRSVSSAFLERLPGRGARRAQALPELVHCGRGDDFVLAVEARLPDNVRETLAAARRTPIDPDDPQALSHLRYEVRFEVFRDTAMEINNEYLYLFPTARGPGRGGGLQGESPGRGRGRRLRHPSWRSVIYRERGEPTSFTAEIAGPQLSPFRVPGDRLAFANLPFDPDSFPAATWFQDLLRDGAVFFDPDWRELREASPPGQPKRVLPDGRNLPWLVKDLQERDPDGFADWVAHVRTALPQIEDIRAVEREEDHFAYLAVSYAGGYEATSSGLSDGTLRVLALTVVPYLVEPPHLFVVEEPENGIHPRAIESVLQSLGSLYGGQVWISTHSPVVVAHTDTDSLLVTRLDDGGEASVVPGREHHRLQAWQGEIDLGTLFAAGVLDT